MIIVIFALYGESINFELSELDDDILIKHNINFISDYKNIPKLFKLSPYYNNTSSYYRPILSLSFAIEAFFIRDNLKFYHLTNIILFILVLYLFYLFCMELKLNSIITKFVLLLIAVHPMFVSVVVWIPGRNDSLLTVFFISSFVCFIRYVNTQKLRFAILFFLFFILSLFTKETFILLIPLYFIYLFLYEYNVSKKKLSILFISLIPIVLTFFILRKYCITTFGYEHYISKINIIFFNFIKYICIFLYNFFVPEYIPMLLFNVTLNVKIITYNCLFISVFAFVVYKKIIPKKIIFFSLLLVFLSLFPTFLQEEIVYLNHRFLICSISFIIVFVIIIDYLIKNFKKIKKFLIAFFVLFLVTFFYISYEQINKYKNSETFWVNVYLDSPNYYLANLHLSKIYTKKILLKEALYYAQKAIELKPCYVTYINYIELLIGMNDFEKAEEFLLSNKEKTETEDSFLLSEIYYRKQDYEKSLEFALKAYNKKPYSIGYCEQLIKIYDEIENYEQELKIYEQLLDYDKRNEKYRNKIVELKDKMSRRKMQSA
ncbi:MAG: hypothetical protein IKN42_03840 [Elusimicrobia bacterium]|nr:hypothetical protein [Elusimicrobiota bacterium]